MPTLCLQVTETEERQKLSKLLGKVYDDEGALAIILATLPDDSPLFKIPFGNRNALINALAEQRLMRHAGAKA